MRKILLVLVPISVSNMGLDIEIIIKRCKDKACVLKCELRYTRGEI